MYDKAPTIQSNDAAQMTPERFHSKLLSVTLPDLLNRHFLLISGILLAILAAAQIGSALQESPTNDEPIHLTAGYVYLTRGEYDMDPSHPPLARVLEALPLLALPLRRPPSGNVWLTLGTLLWDNPPSTALLHARMVIIALSLLFGAWLSAWTRRAFGAPVSLLALFFFVCDPNIIAHGHYVTTDLSASFSIFLACTLWTDFLQKPGAATLARAAGAFGVALICKYSALFLLIVLPLLYVVAWWRKRGQPFFTVPGAISVLLFALSGACVIIMLAYAPAAIVHGHASLAADRRSLNSADVHNSTVSLDDPVGRVLSKLRSAIGSSALRYIQGFNQLRGHNSAGQPSYMLGEFGSSGWWQYFPVTFMVKTTTGALLACLLAAAGLLYMRKETVPFLPLACVMISPAIYFLLAMNSSIDLGVRHILPIYAFLYACVSFILVDYGSHLLGRAWPYTIAALLALTFSESILSYPHYLAFFNWPSGGSANGARYLLDSNLDWGQDTDNLRRYALNAGDIPLCTALFGYTPDNYFGAGWRNLLATGMPEKVENLNCVVAVSANFVNGLYVGPRAFAALRKYKPFAEIGFSIYLYDFRNQPVRAAKTIDQ